MGQYIFDCKAKIRKRWSPRALFGRIPRCFARAVTNPFETSFDYFKSLMIIFTKEKKKNLIKFERVILLNIFNIVQLANLLIREDS